VSVGPLARDAARKSAARLLGSCSTARRAFPTPLAGSLGLELDWEVGIIGIGTSRPRVCVSDGIGGGLRCAPVVVPEW